MITNVSSAGIQLCQLNSNSKKLAPTLQLIFSFIDVIQATNWKSFEAKQEHMYAVFERRLQMDKGRALVISHKASTDAQEIYYELCEDCSPIYPSFH